MEIQESLLENNCNLSLDNYNYWIPPVFTYYYQLISLIIIATVEKYIYSTFYKEYLKNCDQIVHKLHPPDLNESEKLQTPSFS